MANPIVRASSNQRTRRGRSAQIDARWRGELRRNRARQPRVGPGGRFRAAVSGQSRERPRGGLRKGRRPAVNGNGALDRNVGARMVVGKARVGALARHRVGSTAARRRVVRVTRTRAVVRIVRALRDAASGALVCHDCHQLPFDFEQDVALRSADLINEKEILQLCVLQTVKRAQSKRKMIHTCSEQRSHKTSGMKTEILYGW